MKKLFMALLSLLTLLVYLTASADNGQGERWKWYYSGSRVGFYYDINTLSYDSNTNVADVWTKTVDINGNTLFMNHLNLNYITRKKLILPALYNFYAASVVAKASLRKV